MFIKTIQGFDIIMVCLHHFKSRVAEAKFLSHLKPQHC